VAGNTNNSPKKKYGFSVGETLRTPMLVVNFDSNGNVRDSYGRSLSTADKTKQEVLRAWGSPAQVKTNGEITIFNYTLSKYSESFEVRAVIFDQSGRVSEKTSFYYRD
jgi:hypothetical protein